MENPMERTLEKQRWLCVAICSQPSPPSTVHFRATKVGRRTFFPPPEYPAAEFVVSQRTKTVIAGFLIYPTEDNRSLFSSPSRRGGKCGKTLLASVELRQRKIRFGPLTSVTAQIAGTDAFLSSKDHVFSPEQGNKIEQ